MVLGLIGISILIALLSGVFLLGIHFGNNSPHFFLNSPSKGYPAWMRPSRLISFGNETYTATNNSFSLPSAPKPFVGRENETKRIISELTNSLIFTVGLFGPPAYGKSSLAIHIGHRMLKQAIPVNYFDLNELTITFEPSLTSDTYHSNQQSDIQPFTHRSPRSIRAYQKTVNSQHLLGWAKNITRPSILILDNCDSVYNQWQEEFQEFVLDLIEESSQQLTILITSQVEMLFVENFAAHKISELSQEASYTLILQMYPPIEQEPGAQAELAKLVGNCPLAIKVILNLLKLPQSVSPAELIEQLRQNPIRVLTARRLPKKDNFTAVMNMATKYLSLNLKETAFILSLFPGSFEGHFLRKPRDFKDDIDELVMRSLVESYYVVPGTRKRYKLHELIKQYFAQAFQDLIQEKYLTNTFNKQFRLHYTHLFSSYIQSLNFSSLVLDHQDSFYREQHNLKHLLSMIIPAACSELNILEITVVLFAHKMRLIEKDDYIYFSCIIHSFSQKDVVMKICRKYSQTTCFSLMVEVFQTHLNPNTDIQFGNPNIPTPCWILYTADWNTMLKSFDRDRQSDIISSLSTTLSFCSQRKDFTIISISVSLPYSWLIAYDFAYYFGRVFNKAHPRPYQWAVCILLCICSIVKGVFEVHESFFFVRTSYVDFFVFHLLGAVLIFHFFSIKVIIQVLGNVIAFLTLDNRSFFDNIGFNNLMSITLQLFMMVMFFITVIDVYFPINSNKKSLVMILNLFIFTTYHYFRTFLFALYVNTGVQNRIIQAIHFNQAEKAILSKVLQFLLEFMIAFVLYLVPFLAIFFGSKKIQKKFTQNIVS